MVWDYKKMKNFLITAMGRSGTKYLSQIMNRSKLWTVEHEPKGQWNFKSDIGGIHSIRERFNRDYYGEVNSYLRFKADKIEVEKYGIILRDPIEIWLSITNRHPENRWMADLEDLERSIIRLLYYSMKKEFLSISFKRIIKDKRYLENIIKHFGIEDIEITDEILNTKINATKNPKYKSLNDFDKVIRLKVLDLKSKMEE